MRWFPKGLKSVINAGIRSMSSPQAAVGICQGQGVRLPGSWMRDQPPRVGTQGWAILSSRQVLIWVAGIREGRD